MAGVIYILFEYLGDHVDLPIIDYIRLASVDRRLYHIARRLLRRSDRIVGRRLQMELGRPLATALMAAAPHITGRFAEDCLYGNSRRTLCIDVYVAEPFDLEPPVGVVRAILAADPTLRAVGIALATETGAEIVVRCRNERARLVIRRTPRPPDWTRTGASVIIGPDGLRLFGAERLIESL